MSGVPESSLLLICGGEQLRESTSLSASSICACASLPESTWDASIKHYTAKNPVVGSLCSITSSRHEDISML